MKKKNDFQSVILEEFSFLQNDFNFSLKYFNKYTWGYKLLFINETTAVKIVYEFQAAYFFISLYKLVDGVFLENPTNIKSDTLLFGYDLDDIISLQDPDALLKPAYKYGESSKYYNHDNGLRLFCADFASNLKHFAAKILYGDFQMFEQVDAIVKQRVSK